ncbi:hypothetical protein H7J51_16370 [Mycobacterium crocinum]|uniref:DUF2612 domain-containing protein n=1 Tax=Mycolicibacterium crocinum TaxID=388459 RepID=A0ABY3TF90_9MYCO|nr:hypothetical protein [Mycolicibacterium crocinum]MCV7216854.1 hypothetical protein [Mycolicibacterium crocinum]ULN40123.1 hypothetical protein MI149_20835 [Mycolicibacterium crocinum]
MSLTIPDAVVRSDLAVFLDHALRLDEAAVVRLKRRADGLIAAWVGTGLDVLAVRVVAGELNPGDLSCGADELARGLRNPDVSGHVDPGYPMDSAWRGVLPGDTGFTHLDDIPAAVLTELAQRGADLAKEHSSAHGPPASLLDQNVLQVSSGDVEVGVPMRCVFALTAMGFVPDPPGEDEIVRVRLSPTWLRIDARYGSVYRRRGDPALVLR